MLLTLIIKNFKIIFRNKSTLFIIIIFPLLLILLISLSYNNTELREIKLGLINTESKSFEYHFFKITKYNDKNLTKAKEDCFLDLKKSRIDICVQICNSNKNKTKKRIIYYTDNTRPLETKIAVDILKYIVNKEKGELLKGNVKTILEMITVTSDTMKNSQEYISNTERDLKTIILVIETSKDYYEKINKNFSDLINKIDQITLRINKIRKDLNPIFINLENIKIESSRINTILKNINNNYKDLKNEIIILGNVYPIIYKYISLNNMNKIESELNLALTISDYLLSDTKNININLINSKNSLDDIEQKINDLSNILKDLQKEFIGAKTELNKIENEINQRITETEKFNNEINNNLIYFNAIKNKTPEEITEPVTQEESNLIKNFKRVHQVSPITLVLFLMFLGILFTNIIVNLERNSKSYFRNLISPINYFEIILSICITSLFIIFLQLLLLIFIFYIYLNINLIPIKIGQILFISLFGTLIFILIGLLISYLIKNIGISIIMSTFVILIFFLLSDMIIPLQTMTKYMAIIISFNPFVILKSILRRLFFFYEYNISFIDCLPLIIEFSILSFVNYLIIKKKIKNI